MADNSSRVPECIHLNFVLPPLRGVINPLGWCPRVRFYVSMGSLRWLSGLMSRLLAFNCHKEAYSMLMKKAGLTFRTNSGMN